MEKIGLINRIMTQQRRNELNKELCDKSQEMQTYNTGLAETVELCKELHVTKDVDAVFAVEKIMLDQELSVSNSPEEKNSIEKALVQLQEARRSLEVAKAPEAYRSGTETYSSKRREAGLPLDSCREFLKSHTARLSNRMTSNLSVPEKNLLRQRKENLKMVRDVYIGMQREALGLPAQENKRELGR